MAYLSGFVTPESQQSIETFHGLRRTTEGLLYYTKIDKDTGATIDLSDGSPSDVQLPTSGANVEADVSFSSVQYFSGDGSTTEFTMSPAVLNDSRIKVFVNNVEQVLNRDYTYSSPTLTFVIRPANGTSIAVGLVNKEYKNNTTDKYQQYIFEDGDATYFVDSNGYLIKRENVGYGLTALASDDFSTFESTSTVQSTSWQSAS
jgi:hypothetical protein